MEIWKEIEGTNGKYHVSNYGNMKSNKQILKGGINGKGYKTFSIRINGEMKTKRVHRLVAEYFIPRIEGKDQVNHIDGVKTNNHIDNLEWVNNSENQLHSNRLGLRYIPHGSNHAKSKLNEQLAKEIYDLITKSPLTQVQIANAYEIDRKLVTNIRDKYTWKHIH